MDIALKHFIAQTPIKARHSKALDNKADTGGNIGLTFS